MDSLNSALTLIRRILNAVDEGLEASAIPPNEVASAMSLTGATASRTVHAQAAPAAPAAQPLPRPPSPGEQGFVELQDLLDSIGAEPAAPDQDAQLRLKDATISELTSMLAALRPLGEQLAATERARLDLKQRTERLGEEVSELRGLLVRASEELEDERERFELRLEQELERADAPDPLHDELVADYEARLATAREAARTAEKNAHSLERKLEQREQVLAGERERHAATRARLAERKQVAAERWAEIRKLRAELKRTA